MNVIERDRAMKKQLPNSVVVVVVAVAVIAAGAFLVVASRSGKQGDEGGGMPPEAQKVDKMLADVKGDLSKLTPEQRAYINSVRVAGKASASQ